MLNDRIILITGASHGIGTATARLVARHGAAVAVDYSRDTATAKRVLAEIERDGGRALAVRADVRDPAEVENMVETIGERLGPIDTLVLNANVGLQPGAFLESRWDDFEATLTGELKPAFFAARAVAPGMPESGHES